MSDERAKSSRDRKSEEYYFQSFQDHCDFLPQGVWEHHDRPDFWCFRDDRPILGLELTNFYKAPGGSIESEQQQAAIRRKVVRIAEELFNREGQINRRVFVGFDPDIKITDAEKVAFDLAQIVRAEISGRGYLAVHREPVLEGQIYWDRTALAVGVDFIYLVFPTLDRPGWMVQPSGSTTLANPETLQAIVSHKDERSRGYKKFDQLWLLVVVDFWDRAQDQQIDSSLSASSSRFDKVILFQTVFNRIVDIHLKRNS